MNTLHIDVKRKVATYTDRDLGIICGNNDYQIQFTFDSEWDTHPEKTARFVWGGKFYDVDFTGDTCPVPIITNAHGVKVGVYAGDLATTTPALIDCRPSILCGSAKAPHPGSIEQFRDEAKLSADEAKGAAGEAKDAAQEAKAAAEEAKNAAEVDVDLSGYLEKYNSGGALRFYGVSRNGTQTMVLGSDTDGTFVPGRVATYVNDNNSAGSKEPTGALNTKMPTKDYQCANKKYVDDLIAQLRAELSPKKSFTMTGKAYRGEKTYTADATTYEFTAGETWGAFANRTEGFSVDASGSIVYTFTGKEWSGGVVMGTIECSATVSGVDETQSITDGATYTATSYHE